MPVLMVRNTKAGIVILSSDPKGTHQVEWAAADDPMGDDVQPVPEVFQEHPAFMRQVQRGLLVIENPEDNLVVAEAIERQRAAADRRAQGAAAAATDVIVEEANNDIVTKRCVGPDGRGGQCENYVPVKDKKKDDKPPLCSQHANLVDQYIPAEDVLDGKAVRTWKRVTMGARQTADA